MIKIKKYYSFFFNKYILFIFFGIITCFNGHAIELTNKSLTFAVKEFKIDRIILYYVEGATYKSTFLYNDEVYSYLIDANKNIMIFDQEGKQVNLNLKLFIFTDLKEKKIEVDERIYEEPVFFERIVSSENYTKVAKPIEIDFDELREDLNVIISREGLNVKETQYLIFRFDIDEDGAINNARNETSDDSSLHQTIVNYLNKLEDWQPSEISGQPVNSVFEIKIKLPFIYVKKSEIIHEHKKIIKS